MAPSAVEVETVTVPDVSALKLQSLSGQYKEFVAGKFDPEAEAGQKGHAAAKVCRRRFSRCPLDHSETNDQNSVPPLPPNLGPYPEVPPSRAL